MEFMQRTGIHMYVYKYAHMYISCLNGNYRGEIMKEKHRFSFVQNWLNRY